MTDDTPMLTSDTDGETIVPEIQPPPAPAADVTPQEADKAPEKDEGQGFEKMQRRIARLYAQKKSAEEAAETERRRVVELEERLRQVESQLSAGYLPPSGAPSAQFAAPAPGVPPVFDPAQLRDIVQQTVAPIARRLELREAEEKLLSAHEASWASAEEDFPELTAASSEVRKLAEHLLRQDPELRASPAGPYRAVVMAKGFLADAGARRPAERMAAGSVVSSSPVSSETRSKAQLRKEYDELLARGINSPQEYERARVLRAKLRG